MKISKITKYLFLICLLMVIVTVGSTTLLAQDNEEIPFTDLKTPTKLKDMIETFSKLKYNFVIMAEGKEEENLFIEYNYLGKEKLNDVQADKISILINTKKMEGSLLTKFWLYEKEILQIELDGEKIPGQMATMMKDKYLESVFFPFYNFKELDLKQFAQMGQVTRNQEVIGEKKLDVIQIKGNNLEKLDLKSGTVKIADFEKFYMVISFEYLTPEDVKGVFEFEIIELR